MNGLQYRTRLRVYFKQKLQLIKRVISSYLMTKSHSDISGSQFGEIPPISVSEPAHLIQSIRSMALLLETTIGDIVIELDVEGSPELCKNVIKLAHARYYTGNLIYNVVKNRFCQTGDP